MEQKLSDLVKFISRITPCITIASDPLNSIEVNLKVSPVKDSPEHILQLPEKIAEAKGIRVIVCIDEFQQLACLPRWKNMEAMLRSEWQLQHHTTYCLYGSKMHMMKDIFNKASSPFFKFGQLMNLKRISKDYWIPYIIHNFEKTGKAITHEQAEAVCERVQYNSWYVQQYCFFLWSHTEKTVTQKTLDEQLQLVMDTNEDLFLTEMDSLTPTQIGMLKAIASGEKHLNAQRTVEKYGLGQPQSITRNKKVLVEKDLLEKRLTDLYFVDPLFELWIKREYRIES